MICARIKSELEKSVDLSLCGLAPAQPQMNLFLDTRCAQKSLTNQNKSRVAASAMFFQGHDN